jgi:hypothetical protein
LIPAPRIQDALDDGTARNPGFDQRILRFASELEWYAEALRAARQTKGVPY